MLKIYINNQKIDTTGIKINLRLNSPFFFDQTSFSYNFTIPATIKNKKVLNFPDLTGNYNTDEKYSCYVEHSGFYINGQAVVKNIKDKSIELYFIQNYESIIKILKEKKLTQIGYQEEISSLDFLNAYKGDSSSYNFACATVKITTQEDLDTIEENLDMFEWVPDDIFLNYYISPSADIGEQIKDGRHTWDDHSGPTYENSDDENHNYIQKIMSARTPFWYISFIIKKMLPDFTIQSNIFETDDMLKDLFLVTISEPELGTSDYKMKKGMPDETIMSFIKKLETYFNLRFIFDFSTMTVKIVSKKEVINSSLLESWEEYSFKKSQKNVVHGINYEYSFSQERQNYFNDYITGEENKEDVSLPLTIYLSNEHGLDDYTENAYFCYDDAGGDRMYRIFKFPRKLISLYGDNVRQIDVNFEIDKQIPFMLAWQNKDLTDTRIEVFGDGSIGQQQTPAYSEQAGDKYNFAYWRKYDAHDSYDGYSLDIKETGNYEDVYTRFHKPVHAWENNLKREESMKTNISPNKLVNFDFLKKRRIKGQNYLIKKIELEITEQNINVRQIDAVTTP
jgi:hypothetical protein